jgi:ribosomal-protein-alanine N-acetyltransferase
VSNLKLRPAVEADISAIAAIQAAAYWSNFDMLEPGSLAHPGYWDLVVANAQREAETNWRDTTIAEMDGNAAGICVCEFNPALISDLWVLPEMQGRGLGTVLIAEALTRFKARGEKLISIEVHPKNPAVRLYERSGFKLSEVTTRYSKGLGRNLQLWIMTQQII